MIYVGPLMIIGTNVWNASYSTPSWRVMITGTLRVKKLEPHKLATAQEHSRIGRLCPRRTSNYAQVHVHIR